MSSLDRMSIRGVRSFSPEQEQVIVFFSPLTLILGPNGTGKTTIIEALKYITTGELPPHGKSGAFVNDPKLTNSMEVKAQVKLKFLDVRGKYKVTTRSMLATQKLKTVTFRSLDSTVIGLDERTGQKVTITSRCTEINREMVAALGVSQAILNNVIFCHQEHSNWPLGEAKSVKSTFDEIFAATRYIKALDNLADIRKNHEADLKVFNVDLYHLSQNKKKAEEIRGDLQRTETRLAVSKEEVRKIQKKLEPIKESLSQLREKEKTIAGVANELSTRQTAHQIKTTDCKELADKIKFKYEGSRLELANELSRFKEKSSEKSEQKIECERTLKHLKSKTHELSAKKLGILVEIGKLEKDAEVHCKNVLKMDGMAQSLTQSYGIQAPPGFNPQTRHQMNEFESQLKDDLKKLHDGFRVLKEKYEAMEANVLSKLAELRDEKSKLSQTETIRQDEIKACQSKIQDIESDLLRVQGSSSRLDIVEAQLTKKERELEMLNSEFDATKMQNEIQGFKQDIITVEKQIGELDIEMTRLSSQAEAQANLDSARRDKESREDTIQKLKAKHEDAILHLLGVVPKENLRSTFEQYTSRLTSELQELDNNRMMWKCDLASWESDRKTKMEELRKKEVELRDCEEKIFQVCGHRDLDSSLDTLNNSISSLQDETGSLNGTEFLYKKFIGKLKQRDSPCCPLCHRNFKEKNEVDELVSELDNKLRLLPSEKNSKERTLKEQRSKYHSMLELKSTKKTANKLSELEIPDLKRAVNSLANKIEEMRSQVSEAEEVLVSKRSDEMLASAMKSDLVVLDQNLLELQKAEKRIAEARSLLGGLGGNRSMTEVTREKTTLQENLETKKAACGDLETSLNIYRETVHNLQTALNSLATEKNKISKDLQEVQQWETQRTTLINQIMASRKEIEAIQKQLEPLFIQISACDAEKQALLAERDNENYTLRKKVDDRTEKYRDFRCLYGNVVKYLDERKGELLEKWKMQLRNTEEQAAGIAKKEEDVTVKLNRLSEEINGQEIRIRNFEDNLKLFVKKEELEILEQEIERLNRKLGGYDISSLNKEIRTLQEKENRLNGEYQKAVGGQAELQDRIGNIRKDLESDLYADIEERYKKKFIEMTTMKHASSDLKKYANALDRAIMNYHALKMKEINEIIRDLWIRTYKGCDIDYIEIRSDAETKTTSLRKQYHYRVVLIKGDVEHDMRGRCSAGQKVLASLIIRLALAETFCVECNVLALDEPTTNLDRQNIEGLAEALAEIVRDRSKHKNFQLIVITHDEDFIATLGKSDLTDNYYRVWKDQKGNSRFTKQEF